MTTLEAGLARIDITAWEPDMTMLGWGHRRNRVRGVAAPLHARALVLAEPERGTKVAYVCVELLLVAQGLRQTVLDRLAAQPELGLGAHNVVLVANHTHSGPSGYSHHFWVNLSAPGFSRLVYARLADGIVEAIVRADAAREPARVRLGRATVPLADGIAFNRAWRSYNRNPEVAPVTEARRDEATDRTMTVLGLERPDGTPLGVVSWFAVHCTSIHADNDQLHPDNKGLASLELETAGAAPVAIFAQEAAGDVSPNFRYDRARRVVVGRCDDDFESAAYVGAAQARAARRALDAAAAGREESLLGPLECATAYVDFAQAPAEAELTHDGRPHRTTPACVGLSMVMGTAEGPGPLFGHRWVPGAARLKGWLATAARRRRAAGGDLEVDAKVPFLDVGLGLDGRLFGVLSLASFRFPDVDPVFGWVKRQIRAGAVGPGSWVPQVLPLQLIRLGGLAIATLPFEATTIAGRRLREMLLRRLAPLGVEAVVVSPYANAYAGYATTFEEYQAQGYEGGYTLFGPHTLAALLTGFARLAGELAPARPERPLDPIAPRIPLSLVERVPFAAPWPDPPFTPRRSGAGARRAGPPRQQTKAP
jgi:neutral ceramidase